MKNDLQKDEKTKGMKQWVRDLIYGIVIVLFSIGNIVYGSQLPVGSVSLKVAQAGFYLELICGAFALLGLWLIIRSIRKKPDNLCVPLFTRTIIVPFIFVVLYLLLLKKIGFLIDSFLMVLSLSLYLAYKMGKLKTDSKAQLAKKVGIYIVYAAIMTMFCYFMFGKVMKVILPKFSLF